MAENDSININIGKITDSKVFKILKDKRVQVAIALILFAILLVNATSVRLSGLSNLKDKTTGNYVLADPDAFYEYRVAEVLLTTGNIGGIDPLRNPGLNLPYTQEMLPSVLANSYKIFHSVNHSITLDYIDAIYPVIAFAIGLVIFFALCWYLSKSKFLALFASAMLAYSATYFQRTGAGISSHEVLGLIFMFFAFLVYAYSMNNYKKGWKWAISLGLLTGITLALSLYSWSGGSNFALIIFPLSSLVIYLFGEDNKELKKKFIAFNVLWIFASIAMMPVIGYPISNMTSRFLSNYGIIAPFLIIFMIVDFFLESYQHKIKAGQSKKRVLYSLAGTVLVGFIGLFLMGKNPLTLIYNIYNQLLFPFGQGRVGLTVAYYAQPYLTDLISQIGRGMFWAFFLGIVLIGIEFGKNIKNKKDKIYFYVIWILSVSGMIFTRISSSSFLNGSNFISSVLYVLSFVILGTYLLWLHIKEKFPIDTSAIFLFSWMIITLMSIRSAIRVMFVVVTFVFVAVAFFIVKCYQYGKKTNNSTWKYTLFACSLIGLFLAFNFVFGNPLAGTAGNYQAVSYYSHNNGPITGAQWQNSMAWVRNNTSPDSVFISWWDYGYLIQTLGNRTTVVDGGNSNQYWDHLVGRYLLTEPNENASLSFMKSHNVSYLLIDPTDLGKYPAFSSIGSDASSQDRFSQISVMPADPTQTTETAAGESIVYSGASPVDQDIIYQSSNGSVFIPSQSGALIGIIINVLKSNTSVSFKQPVGVFLYNNQQIRVPLRYIYYKNQIVDFKSGINSVAMIIPSISSNGQNVQIGQFGAVIYLSPRTSQSLYAQLYLLNDAFKRYPTVTLANSQPDPLLAGLNAQGANLGNFVYYQGFIGPLDIWKVNYPSYIISRPEFLSPEGQYAEFDNLTFTK